MLANGPTLTVNRSVESVARPTTSLPSTSNFNLAGQSDTVDREVEGAAFVARQGEDIISFAATQTENGAPLVRADQARHATATQQAEADPAEETKQNQEALEQAVEQSRDEEEKRLQRITEELNDKLNESLRLRFEKDQDTGVDVFKLIERESGDVVRQVPSEEVLEFMRKFRSFSGLLFSEQA